MRFLLDAQLPARLCALLHEAGHDAAHTSDLPYGNRSTDAQVSEAADSQGRVLVTKDADFRNSHLLTGKPQQLLVVSTGNISNSELLELAGSHIASIERAFVATDYVELGRAGVVVHPSRPS